MGMPITVEIVGDSSEIKNGIDAVFDYFKYVDEKFSTYKPNSEISRINRGELGEKEWSEDMRIVFALSEKAKKETNGYFDIVARNGKYDPSGLVKGWSIWNAANLLKGNGLENFFIDAGGDVQVSGKNNEGKDWRVGIRNPFKPEEIVKVLFVRDKGVATSGTYLRGQHIYNPKKMRELISEIVSLTVIGSNIYEADRFATAAFAMGKDGISFIQNLKDFEGYMIDKDGIATMTTGFNRYTAANA